MNLLFTCVGRKVSLIRAFQRALAGAGRSGQVVAADSSATAPGIYAADRGVLVPEVSSDDYIQRLLKISQDFAIRMVIPVTDYDLQLLAARRPDFLKKGVEVLVSESPVVDLFSDKLETFRFLRRNGIPTPDTKLYRPDANWKFPLFVKPRFGSGSSGARVAASDEELRVYCQENDEFVVQELLGGQEYTIDCLCDMAGNVVHIIPRKRLKVRAGETSRGVTVRDDRLTSIADDVLRSGPSFIGPVTIQAFDDGGSVKVTEVNPRFGGGVPLSIRGGGNFPTLLVRMWKGECVESHLGEFQENLYMLRYETAVFVDESELVDGSRCTGETIRAVDK